MADIEYLQNLAADYEEAESALREAVLMASRGDALPPDYELRKRRLDEAWEAIRQAMNP